MKHRNINSDIIAPRRLARADRPVAATRQIHWLRIILLFLTGALISTIGILWWRNDAGTLPVPPTMSASSTDQAFVVPVELRIPTLGITSSVERVGVNPGNGAMAVPSNYQNVAWYEPGVAPGEVGNAVMAGHLDNSLGLDAVFADLHKLEIGDLVEVVGQDGEVMQFRVLSKAEYDYRNAPLEKIFGPSDEAHLNLITCIGSWISSVSSYDKRLVVKTVRVE